MQQQSTGPTEDSQKDKCSSCGRTIGEYEGAYTTEEGLICSECDGKVTNEKVLSDEQDGSETIEKPSMEMYLNPVSSSHWNVLTGSCVISWACLTLLIFLPNNVSLQGVATLGRIVAASVCLVLLFRFWEPLQVVNLRINPFFVILFIPSIAASLALLVPLFRWEVPQIANLLNTFPFIAFVIIISVFSIYSIFRVFLVWTLSYNKIISKFHLNIRPMSTGLGLLASTAPLFIGIVFFIAGGSLNSSTSYCVKRGGEIIPITHQGQLKPGEKVYMGGARVLYPVSPKTLPESLYPHLLFLVACIACFDVIYILFCREALSATNSLIEQIEFKES